MNIFGFLDTFKDEKVGKIYEPRTVDEFIDSVVKRLKFKPCGMKDEVGNTDRNLVLAEGNFDGSFCHLGQGSEMDVGFGCLVVPTESHYVILGGPADQQKLSKDVIRSISIGLDCIHVINDSGGYVQYKYDNLDVIIPKDDSQVWNRVVTGETHTVLLNVSRQGYMYSPGGVVSLGVEVREVSCGKEHIVLIDSAGRVMTMGNGSRGQLGLGSLESEDRLRVVEMLDGITCTSVSAGGWHTAAITDCGDLFIWGWNQTGQLGLMEMNEECGSQCHDSVSPTKQTEKIHVTQATSSTYKSSCENPCENFRHLDGSSRDSSKAEVISEESEIEEKNEKKAVEEKKSEEKVDEEMSFGDMSPVSMVSEPVLVEIEGGRPVVDVACGSRHTLALTGDGRLYVWGWNKYGQLGVPSPDVPSPDVLWSPVHNPYFTNQRLPITSLRAAYWTSVVLTRQVTS